MRRTIKVLVLGWLALGCERFSASDHKDSGENLSGTDQVASAKSVGVDREESLCALLGRQGAASEDECGAAIRAIDYKLHRSITVTTAECETLSETAELALHFGMEQATKGERVEACMYLYGNAGPPAALAMNLIQETSISNPGNDYKTDEPNPAPSDSSVPWSQREFAALNSNDEIAERLKEMGVSDDTLSAMNDHGKWALPGGGDTLASSGASNGGSCPTWLQGNNCLPPGANNPPAPGGGLGDGCRACGRG